MDLKCEYKMESLIGFSKKFYTCMINSVSITSIDNRTIPPFVGVHHDDKSDNDVEAVWISDSVVKFFPQGLSRIFPQLIAMSIFNCGLIQITRDDLKGLGSLEAIYLNSNKLTTLPNDLFEDMPKLKRIIFYNNKLKYVSSELLESIKDNELSLVNFSENGGLDAFYWPGKAGTVSSIDELMEIIDTRCKAPRMPGDKDAHDAKISQGFMKWMKSPHLSDFVIVAGSERFPVHKWILGIQSSVFADMFKVTNKEDQANELKIEDLSTEAVADFLRYIYTGEYPDSDNALDAFVLAAKLNVLELKVICEEIVTEDILDNSNAFKIFTLSQIHASEKLKRAAFGQIKLMLPDIADFTERLIDDPESLKKLIEQKLSYDKILNTFKKP